MHRYLRARTGRSRRRILETAKRYNVICRVPKQLHRIGHLLHWSDASCVANIRMDRNTFAVYVIFSLSVVGCIPTRSLGWRNKLPSFLEFLHTTKRIGKSGLSFGGWGPFSYYINKVLDVDLSLHSILLSKPTPVTDDCVDNH